MESLGDILRRLTQRSTSGGTGAWPGSEPPPEEEPCPHCRGLGWVRPAVPLGHPDFGKAVLCSCQERDSRAQRAERLRRYSNLGYLARHTFASLDPRGPRPGVSDAQYSAALEQVREYARDPRGWLVLTGPSGSGKTVLAAAVANHCLDQGAPVFFVTVADLLDHLRSAFAPTSDVTYDELFEQVRNAPLLVLDDLGAHSSTPWAEEKLYQVINHRFNAQLPTVVTLGVPLERLDERLRTRLQAPDLARVVALGSRTPGLLTQIPEGGLGSDLLQQMTFDGFDVRGNNADAQARASLEAALKGARAFAADPHGWLLLMGGPGCGKTHLAVAVANERVRRGAPVLFAFVPAFLDYLRSAFGPDARHGYDEMFELVKQAPLLVLDDLGSESSTPWAEEKLYQVIVHRHNARLPTVITTSRLLEEMRPAIASRLKDTRLVNVLPIGAPDYRDQDRARPAARRAAPGRASRASS